MNENTNESGNSENSDVNELIKEIATNSIVWAVIAGGATVAVMTGQVTVPPWVIDGAKAAALAGIIGFLGGDKIADLLSEPPEFEEIVEIDSEREVVQTWFVPQDAWDDRRNESDSLTGAYLMEGTGNYAARDVEWDDDDGVVVVREAPARQKIAERTDVDIETWVDAIWRQRGEFRDTVREAAELRKSLPEIRDEIAAEYYRSETRELEEATEHNEDVLFDPVDARVSEIREEARRNKLTDEEKAVREVLRDVENGVESDFERLNVPQQDGGDDDE